MRPTLHEKTLALVKAHIKNGGQLKALAESTDNNYHQLWQWLRQRKSPSYLNADGLQRIYEHLTGKELDY